MSWVEKYRPKKPEDFVGNEDIVKNVFSLLDDEMTGVPGKELCPHLLFIGKEGIGKTSLVQVIRVKYGFKDVKEVNASGKARVEFLRTNLDKFCKTNAIKFGNGRVRKLLVLEEFDNASDAFYDAFRRMMEVYAKRVLVIATANYENKIIPPILSRFAKYRLLPVADSILKALLQRIAKAEQRDVSDEVLDLIVKKSAGKPRDAIQVLQSAKDGKIQDVEIVLKTRDLIRTIRDQPFFSFKEMRRLVTEVPNARSIIEVMLDVIVLNDDAPVGIKKKVAKKLARYDYRLVMGGTAEVQMASLVADFVDILETKKKDK